MTKVGWITVVTGIVLAIAGWTLQWPAFIFLGLSGIVTAGAGAAVTFRRVSLEIHRVVEPTRIPRRSLAVALVEARNMGRRRTPGLASLMSLGNEEIVFSIPRLERGQTKIRSYPLPTHRRGIWELSPVTLRRRDPLGMASLDEVFGSAVEFVIEPADLRMKPISTGRELSLDGPTSDNAPQGTVSFHRLREYVHGDDLRMIHWRSTAKTGGRQLLVRHNVDTVEPTTVLFLNLRPENYTEEEFEDAIDVAASVVRAEVIAKAKVMICTTAGDRIWSAGNALPCIDYLTRVKAQSIGGFVDELLAIGRERRATSLVVVTGSINDEEVATVAKLRRRFAQVVILSIGESAAHNPFSGITLMSAPTAEKIAQSWNGGRHEVR